MCCLGRDSQRGRVLGYKGVRVSQECPHFPSLSTPPSTMKEVFCWIRSKAPLAGSQFTHTHTMPDTFLLSR